MPVGNLNTMPKLILRIRAPRNISNAEARLRQYEWFIFANSGSLDTAGKGNQLELVDALATLDDWCKDPGNITVLVPGSQTLFVQAVVPGRSRNQMQKALPFVVEEFLAEDLDQVHIAHRTLVRGKPVDCFVVSRSLITEWLAVLEAAALYPGMMMVDTDVLPEPSDQLHVFIGGSEALLKGAGLMLNCARQDVVSLLEVYLQQKPLAEEADVIPVENDMAEDDGDGDTHTDSHIHSREMTIHLYNQDLDSIEKSRLEAGCPTQIDWVVHDNQSLTETEYLVQRAIERQVPSRTNVKQPLNLLQNEFEAVASSNETWLRWRSVATMAFALCLLLLVTESVKALWIGYKADQLTNQSVALYKDIFKNDRRVNAATLQRRMAAYLGEDNNSQPGFLNMLGRIAKVVGEQPSGPKLENLSYNNTRGELTAQLSLRDYEILESVKTALIDSGMSVDIRTAEQKGSQVTARLLVRN